MDIPVNCISFSPNWFYSQIATMNENLLFYGSNDSVYVLNHKLKRFHVQLCMSSKVTLLMLDQNLLYVGQEGGLINIYDINYQPPKFKGKIELNMQNVILLKKLENGGLMAMDERGIGVEFKLKDFEIINFAVRFLYQDKPKYLMDGPIAFYEKGGIHDGKKLIQYPFKILYVDQLEGLLLLLVKRKSQLALHIITYDTKENLINTLVKWSEFTDSQTIESMLDKTQAYYVVRMHFNENLPKIDKASVSAIFFDRDTVLVSSRQGEFYSFKWRHDVNYQEVKFHPAALQVEDAVNIQPYKLPLEAHYKAVYLLQKFDYHVLSLGVDRRIAILDEELDIDWRISLLGSKVSKLQPSKAEPSLVFFDGGGFRSMDLSKKHDGCYINEFWKGIPTYENFHLHPNIEGVVLFQNKEKFNFWDLYKESSIATFEFTENVAKVIWFSSADRFLEFVSQFEYKREDLKHVKNDQKHLRKNYELGFALFLTQSAKLVLVDLKSFKKLYQGSISQTFRLEEQLQSLKLDLITVRTQHFRAIETDQSISFILVINENILISITYQDQNLTVDFKSIHHQITSVDFIQHEDRLLLATGGDDKHVNLHEIKNKNLVQLVSFEHRYPIQKVQMTEKYILSIARQHQTLQIWDISGHISGLSKEEKSLNIRGHNGFITDATFYQNKVITCSDDQTVKVWDLEQTYNPKPPNKKKNKKNVPQVQAQKKVKLNTGKEQIV